MKVTGEIKSELVLGTYRFDGNSKLLAKFPANENIYFTHFVE